jgi:predicted ester cyclase
VSAEENEAVFRRWIDAYNERDKQAEGDARAPGYVAHAPGVPEPLDSDAWEEFIFEVFAGAFPDLRLTIEEIGCSDDTVAARIAFRGTHRGEFQGLPPTNREVAFTSVEIDRMVDGKVAEHWFDFDQGKLFAQLGLTVIPGPRLLPRILGYQVKKLRSRLPGKR